MNFKNNYKINLLKKAFDKINQSFSLKGYTNQQLQAAHNKITGNIILEELEVERLHLVWKEPRFLNWIKKYKFYNEICPNSIPKNTSGTQGVVYFSNSNKNICDGNGKYVCKITDDDDEGVISSLVIDYKNKGKNLNVPHIDVARLDTPDFMYYAIIQEKVSLQVPEKIRYAVSAIGNYLTYQSNDMETSWLNQPSPDKVIDYNLKNKFMDMKEKEFNELIPEIELLLKIIYNIFHVSGRWFADLHGDNVGMKGKNPMFFDLGLNYEIIEKPVKIKDI